MQRIFDEFNVKFKFIFGLEKDAEVARELGIEKTSFATMKRNDNIPYDKVIDYCTDKCIDLNWILKIKQSN